VVTDDEEGCFYLPRHGAGQPKAISTGDSYFVVCGSSPGVRPAPKMEEDNISGARKLASAACMRALLFKDLYLPETSDSLVQELNACYTTWWN